MEQHNAEIAREVRLMLAGIYGIGLHYFDCDQVEHFITDSIRSAMLKAIGVSCQNLKEAQESLDAVRQADFSRCVEPFLAIPEKDASGGVTPRIQMWIPEGPREFEWMIVSEGTSSAPQTVFLSSLTIEESTQHRMVGWSRFTFVLPQKLSTGLYSVRFNLLPGHEYWGKEITILVHPRTCFHWPEVETGAKFIGFSLPSRSLRPREGMGAGTWGELRRTAKTLARRGVDYIVIPPSATGEPLFPQASPFLATTRRAPSHLHVPLKSVMKRLNLKKTLRFYRSEPIQARIAELRNGSTIKAFENDGFSITLLERMWEEFLEGLGITAAAFWEEPHAQLGPHFADFHAFISRRGDWLLRYVEYALARERFFSSDNLSFNPAIVNGWHFANWPAEFRTPGSSDCVQLRTSNPHRAGFYAFLLWLGATEKNLTQASLKEAGMLIGLWDTVSVGVAQGGADHYAAQHLLSDLEAGSPPDPYCPFGQQWGYPPPSPRSLRDLHYAPLIQDLEAMMEGSGGLVIDHGMIVSRLYAIPSGATPRNSAYLLYNSDEQLAILAYLSHRHKCVVAMEVLGTVPPGLVEKIRQYKILTSQIYRFPRKSPTNPGFINADQFGRFEFLWDGDFNLVPMAGFFKSWDIRKRRELGENPVSLTQMAADRTRDQLLMLRAAREHNLITEQEEREFPSFFSTGFDEDSSGPVPAKLIVAMLTIIVASSAAFNVIDGDSVLGTERMQNLPGYGPPGPGKVGYESFLQFFETEDFANHPNVVALLKAAANAGRGNLRR